MIRYFCDKCGEKIEGGASGVIIPGVDTKEFCCYRCAQRYMEEMKGKGKIKEYFCGKCGEKLGIDHFGFATEFNFRGTFFSGRIVKFCSVECMIEWIKRERCGVTQYISRKIGSAPVYNYSNPEIGDIKPWWIRRGENYRLYVKREVWDELVGK